MTAYLPKFLTIYNNCGTTKSIQCPDKPLRCKAFRASFILSAAGYAAVDENAALDTLWTFAEHWDRQYPKISSFWRDNEPNLNIYFKYPQEIRRLIYTTNTIEGFKRQLRKVTKTMCVFPADDSLLKMLYMVMMDSTKKWTG